MSDFFEPGSANSYERQEIKDTGPPPGFVDNTVYVYRLDENGNKVLIRTEEAIPDNNLKDKTIDWGKILPQAQELMAKGLSYNKAAIELKVNVTTLYNRLKRAEKDDKAWRYHKTYLTELL